jgi:hypothetical protein
MPVKQFAHDVDTVISRNIGKPHNAGMRGAEPINQSAEIGVYGDKNPSRLGNHRQKLGVTGIRPAALPSRCHVMSLVTQPLSQPPPGAAVHQELQPGATVISSRRSSATTA